MVTGPSSHDEQFQHHILQGVSRTFALTIPQLPEPLYRAVANAYLLCRIADTIEDDAGLSFADKARYATRFIEIVEGLAPAEPFAAELSPLLAEHATAAERELVRGCAAVIRITHAFNPVQRSAMARCVRIMAEGMVHYQGQETLDGVADQAAMDRYCYYVAGVVGEMLTTLFCHHCPNLAARETELMHLAVSFGQGLQMTNILKDVWDDRARGACWLPRDIFAQHGVTLSQVEPGRGGPGFEEAFGQLIAVAHGHLRNALRYTLLLPGDEPGIRRFCLWALGMAVLTLRKLNRQRSFDSGAAVKISRRAVKGTILTTNALVRSDTALRALFELASTGLPQRRINTPIASIADIAGSRLVP
ncbi:MAG: phytoene/squalene synthase family protein [Gammaproteobacteria bacterium]